MTPRILFIAYHYPPENAIGAERPFRFAKYLQKQGFACHVITAVDTSSRPDLVTTFIPDPFVHSTSRGLGYQFERALRKFVLPGVMGTRWSDAAYHAGLRYIETHASDPITIFSTFPPVGVHLAAYRLARKTDRPWIADFRDPMANNPILQSHRFYTRAAYRWMERRVVQTADLTLANTDNAQELLQRSYPQSASKMHLLWNGFDPEQRVAPLPLPARPFRLFTHTGELYQGRSVTPLLLSVQRLIERGRLSSAGIRINLIGHTEPTCIPDSAFMQAAQSAGWLSVTPRHIPKADAQLAAQTSDGLVIVQPQSAVQVPGKVYEYLQIGRPLLAFLPPDSTVERLLTRAGVPYRCVYPAMSPDAFDNALLEFFHLPSNPVSANPWFEETFNAINQTAYLAALVNQLQRP